MKRILLFGILLIAMTVSGCSSGAATNSNARAGNTANRSANPSNTVTETTVTNTDVQTGTLASVPVGPEQGTVAANGIDAKRKLAVDADPGGPIPESQRLPASENSEMATTMDKAGNFVETRYFKSDPKLVKVQRTWLGPGKSTLKIWLKNGKEVTVSGDSIPNLAEAPVTSLLALAGIKTAAPGDTGAK
ncbi:MAG: hypothetical protein KA956_11135 [Pyrinomonadaceae bacterium]|nr:hypothetical protein [Pyrinomonadaceae bacterium]